MLCLQSNDTRPQDPTSSTTSSTPDNTQTGSGYDAADHDNAHDDGATRGYEHYISRVEAAAQMASDVVVHFFLQCCLLCCTAMRWCICSLCRACRAGICSCWSALKAFSTWVVSRRTSAAAAPGFATSADSSTPARASLATSAGAHAEAPGLQQFAAMLQAQQQTLAQVQSSQVTSFIHDLHGML